MTPLEVKAVVRYRDGYRCTRCGMTNEDHIRDHGRSLDVHRIVPGSAYTLEGCETVCRACHSKMPRRDWGTVERTHRHFRFSGEFARLIREYAKKKEESINSVFGQALTEFLRSRDFWPPKSGQ
jgi:5-methylcytosine-specific restriction endonuclease McrA